MSVSSASLSFTDLKGILSSGQYNIVPVYKVLHADLETPVSAYLKIADGSYSFLLESIEGGEWQARYSYIGSSPYKILEQNDRDPLKDIEKELRSYRMYVPPDLPAFTGGAVGYISYDCVKYFERTVKISDANPLKIPESIFLFCTSLVIFDHVKHHIKVVSHVALEKEQKDTDEKDLEKLYEEAIYRIDQLIQRLATPLPPDLLTVHVPSNSSSSSSSASSASSTASSTPALVSNVGQSGYEGFVSRLKFHINEGDIIQAVPSHRCRRALQGVSALDIYRSLRMVNPSPYMFFMQLKDLFLVGASPEQLVKVEGRRVTTHPIAGTRRRGKTTEEDLALEKELLASVKERAEHIMLVDLGRNDLGRVSTPGTVKVDSLMEVERYSHVMHIVSHVSGQLAEDKTVYDAFRSVFPAGTVSGAPKIRAMQLVGQMENQRRGVYAGAVGYVSYSGVLDTAIAIRTIVVKDNAAYLQAGAGIVYDSEPTEEYNETIFKMKGLATAIDKAEEAAKARAQLKPLLSGNLSALRTVDLIKQALAQQHHQAVSRHATPASPKATSSSSISSSGINSNSNGDSGVAVASDASAVHLLRNLLVQLGKQGGMTVKQLQDSIQTQWDSPTPGEDQT